MSTFVCTTKERKANKRVQMVRYGIASIKDDPTVQIAEIRVNPSLSKIAQTLRTIIPHVIRVTLRVKQENEKMYRMNQAQQNITSEYDVSDGKCF